jgi:hypothetical protein
MKLMHDTQPSLPASSKPHGQSKSSLKLPEVPVNARKNQISTSTISQVRERLNRMNSTRNTSNKTMVVETSNGLPLNSFSLLNTPKVITRMACLFTQPK